MEERQLVSTCLLDQMGGLKLNLTQVSEHGLWTTFLIVQWEQDSLALVIIHKSGG
jgi:hypothetical protein